MSEAAAGPSPEVRALLDQAVVHHREGRLDEAAGFYRQVLKIDANEPNALTNLGTIALQQGRLAEGVELIERSLKIRPNQSNAINNLGNAHLAADKLEEALDAYDRAIALDAANAEAHSNRGIALMGLGRTEVAVEAFRRAVELKPDFLDALNRLGLAYEALGRLQEGLETYDAALIHAPEAWEFHFNRGNALRGLGRLEEATAAYERGLQIAPGVAGAYVNYGVALQWLGRFQDAIAAFDRALQLDSDCVDAHWNSALLRLMHGDYETGWKQYEWRWRKPDFNQVGRPGGPMWLGQTPLEGIRLYLVNEQGFGDTLQMMRYAALARERGATVLLNVDPALKELAATVPGVARVVSGGDPVAYDMWTPMMSLPLAFGTTLETVPNKVPYISADPAKVAAWRERLGETRRPRVGLAWSGRAAHANDRNRSLRLAELVPLLDADAEFISLQREYREADRPLLADLPIRDVSEQLTNFSDTAALIEILDLVIAVDTSVAHLAGALARPFCVMIAYVPDFRWGLTGDTTPWYPTAKLLRQPRPGDWGSVIDRARAEIAALKA